MKDLPSFLPVIHVTGLDQARKQAEICWEAGVNGFFLIAHKMSFANLLNVYNSIRGDNLAAWIGINFLDRMADEAVKLAGDYLPDVDGLWVDALVCKEPGMTPMRLSGLARYHRAGEQWRFFAGTNFKYQKAEPDPDAVTVQNSKLFDVVCTSGPATGSPPNIEKIKRMRRFLADDTPLAVASGISAANVRPFVDYVETFLVASSLEASHGELVAGRITEMLQIINEQNHA